MKRLKALRELREELGAEVFLVGGTVRDLVRRREPNDLDLVVRNIAPLDFEAFLRTRGDLRLVGKSFGVYLFRPKRARDFIEIAFPRTEVSTGDGHRDFVVHSDPAISIEEDSQRRDFTLNSLYLSIDDIEDDGKFDRRAIIDFHNGLEHIRRRLVVAVGNPEDRIHEDPLRMLRAMVLVARTGYRLEGNTFGAIKRYVELIGTVAPERIRGGLRGLSRRRDRPERVLGEVPPRIEPGCSGRHLLPTARIYLGAGRERDGLYTRASTPDRGSDTGVLREDSHVQRG